MALPASHLVLRWSCATLQEADNVTGPWNDVGGASPSWSISLERAKKFYRVRR